MDGEMEPQEAEAFSLHLDECAQCKKIYEEMLAIQKELRAYAEQIPDAEIDMEQVFLPKNNKEKTNRSEKSKTKQKFLLICKKSASYAAVFLLGIALYAFTSGLFGGLKNTGGDYRDTLDTGGSTQSQQDAAPDAAKNVAGNGEQPKGDANKQIPENLKLSPDKIIYTCSMTVEVKTYEEARQNIASIVAANQSFIQSEEVSVSEKGGYEYYTSYYKIRVPVAQYALVIEKLNELGEVKYSVQQASNISYEYRDIQGNIEQLNIQKQRLLSLYQQTAKVSELIEIENELTRINTQIKDYQNMLINYDREVEYSTIQLSISERISGNTLANPFEDLGKRIKEAFINSINALTAALVFIFLLLVKILPFAVGAAAIFFFVRWVMKKRKARKE